MNSFNLTLSGKHFICLSVPNESFARQHDLGYWSLLFISLNTSFQPLLACKVSFKKSTDSLMGNPLQVTPFPLLLLGFSLSLILGYLMMMCVGVFLFGSKFLGTLCSSCICMSISFKLRRFSIIIFSNTSLISCSLSSFGTPMMQMLVCLKLSQRLLALSTFFWIVFSSCCSDWLVFAFLYSKLLI